MYVRACLRACGWVFVCIFINLTCAHARTGANTSDIITQYISTIRSLRLLDPSGVTLEAVGGDIRAYLSERPDTVRCIVSR